jgi:hypothetical protein
VGVTQDMEAQDAAAATTLVSDHDWKAVLRRLVEVLSERGGPFPVANNSKGPAGSQGIFGAAVEAGRWRPSAII